MIRAGSVNFKAEDVESLAVAGWIATYASFRKDKLLSLRKTINGECIVTARGVNPKGEKTVEIRMVKENGGGKLWEG